MKLRRLTFAACLALTSLTACSTGSSTSPAASPVTYTCCAAEDVDTLYQPGQTMTLHWIVKSNDTAEGSPQVELTARLTGPYETVAEIKLMTSDAPGTPGHVTFAAVPLRPSGAPGERPVSTILIGSDAKPGYYSLVFSITEDGGAVSGASIVRVVDKA